MAGETVAYLEIALEAAKKARWLEAQLNAAEGAKYAGIEGKLEAVAEEKS